MDVADLSRYWLSDFRDGMPRAALVGCSGSACDILIIFNVDI